MAATVKIYRNDVAGRATYTPAILNGDREVWHGAYESSPERAERRAREFAAAATSDDDLKGTADWAIGAVELVEVST